jgi:hypothetical protein
MTDQVLVINTVAEVVVVVVVVDGTITVDPLVVKAEENHPHRMVTTIITEVAVDVVVSADEVVVVDEAVVAAAAVDRRIRKMRVAVAASRLLLCFALARVKVVATIIVPRWKSASSFNVILYVVWLTFLLCNSLAS